MFNGASLQRVTQNFRQRLPHCIECLGVHLGQAIFKSKVWILNFSNCASYSLKRFTSFIVLSLAVGYGKPSHPRAPYCTHLMFLSVSIVMLSQFILIHFPVVPNSNVGPLLGFLCSHTVRHGRTPPDEWSARRRNLYLHRTTQHINTRDKHPCPQRDSNPRYQQPSGRRPTP
jgi:hypothetical protein